MTSNTVWPSTLDLSIVGPGKVGSSLAFWSVEMGADLIQIGARRESSALALSSKLGGRYSDINSLSSDGEDLLLITVADTAIATVASTLAQRKQAGVVLHTCGRLDSSVLQPLRDVGSSVGTLHPLMAFAEISTNVADAEAVVFGVEGDPEAVELAQCLSHGWGGKTVEIAAELRPLYHLLATLAAGGVVTLLTSACELASRIGLDPAIAGGYLKLARGALDRVDEFDSPVQAITGPIARGEMSDYLKQIDLLRQIDPELATLAKQLALRTELLLKRDGA